MNKKLPKIYANTIDKPITNNKNVYHIKANENTQEDLKNHFFDQEREDSKPNTVEEKIEKLLHSSRHIFSINVDIVTDQETLSTRIAGKRGNDIITLDNKIIPIYQIKDIKIKDQI